MLQEQVAPLEAGAFAMGCGLWGFLWPWAPFACRQQSFPLLVLAHMLCTFGEAVPVSGTGLLLLAAVCQTGKILQTHCLWQELDVEGSYLFVHKVVAHGANMKYSRQGSGSLTRQAWQGARFVRYALGPVHSRDTTACHNHVHSVQWWCCQVFRCVSFHFLFLL